jgi:DNA repair photolyase
LLYEHVFAIVARMALRWALAENEGGGTLFPDERVAERHVGKGAYAGMEFLHVNARTIINTVPAESRMPFKHTINPYRGCSHACVYCFARPTHDYLGLGIGADFERKIVVKVNAIERVRAELRAPGWGGDHIAMGTNTDPYQHAEGKYHLTRGIVETLSGARNAFSILTKSTLILRDAALLAAASGRTDVGVSFSIGTLDRSVWSLTEPGTPPPDRRVEALRRLTAMGIPCGVLVAPVLPGLSDSDAQLTEVVEACADAGAVSISGVALHLRGTVRGHYLDWLARERPELVRLHRERFRRGGYQPDEERQRIEGIVRVAARRCGVSGRNRYRGTPPATAPPAAPAESPAHDPEAVEDGRQLRLL